MACYSPLSGYRSRTPGKNGGFGIVFNRSLSNGQCVEVSCGQCIGCRLELSRMWAVRCVHEASLYDENCFITLTYRPEDLPLDGSLNKVHFQKFMKRLRRFFLVERLGIIIVVSMASSCFVLIIMRVYLIWISTIRFPCRRETDIVCFFPRFSRISGV